MHASAATEARDRVIGGGSEVPGYARVVCLTDRECEVLDLLCIGLSNAQIACRLGIAVSTVKNHLRTAYIKLGVLNRAEVVAVLLSVDPSRR